MTADQYIRLTIGEMVIKLALLQGESDEHKGKIQQLEAQVKALTVAKAPEPTPDA